MGAKRKQDRLQQLRELQRAREHKREERRVRGEAWESKNAIVQKRKEKERKEERARRRKEEEDARQAAKAKQEEDHVTWQKGREDGRVRLHNMWAKNQAYCDRQCEEMAREKARKKAQEREERRQQKAAEDRAAQKKMDDAHQRLLQSQETKRKLTAQWQKDQNEKQHKLEDHENNLRHQALCDHRRHQDEAAAEAARNRAAQQAKTQMKAERRAALRQQESDRLKRMAAYSEVAMQEAAMRREVAAAERANIEQTLNNSVSKRHDMYKHKWKRLDRIQNQYHQRRQNALAAIYMVNHPMFGTVDIRRARSAGHLGANMGLVASLTSPHKPRPATEVYPLQGKHSQYGSVSPSFDRQFMSQTAPMDGKERSRAASNVY